MTTAANGRIVIFRFYRRYCVRLNARHLEDVTVLETVEGGDLMSIHERACTWFSFWKMPQPAQQPVQDLIEGLVRHRTEKEPAWRYRKAMREGWLYGGAQ